MPDEQIIYLGPEEELTTIRERLEHAQAGHIMLVIPPQTQIRSHGWRLLHSRMRALGKEVLVISSDRQIRAVAKAAGFRVADSLESSPSGRSRPSSHPIRSDTGGKTAQRARTQAGRGSADYRSTRQQQQANQPRLATNEQAQQSRREAGSKTSRVDETLSAPGVDAASSTYEIQDIQFGAPYEVHIDTSPSIRPLLPKHEDKEPDQLEEDFRFAQSIREAAQGADTGIAPPAPEIREPSGVRPGQQTRMPSPGEMQDDPFAYMEDIQPISLPEQRASTYIEDIDPGVPDISDVPTDIMEAEIEDLGDEGEILVPPPVPIFEEPGVEETPRVYGMPPRNSRVGNMSRPPVQDIDDEEKLVPIQDQPTQVTPSTVGNRVQQPAIQPQARSVSTRAATQQTKQPTRGSRPGIAAPPIRRASSTSSRRRNRIIILVSIGVVAVVLAVLALYLFFGSNATVTITVPSQTSSLTNLSFEASTNRHDTQHNTIPSVVLTYTANALGQGTATGTIKQGTVSATGYVVFTNKGNQSLDIPTGTIISTSGAVAVQFETTADALIPLPNNPVPGPPVPVRAVNPGDSGNVGASSITLIPPDSLTKIAQNNGVLVSSINLSVTNPQPTTGGGVGNVTSVTSNDINTLAKTLHQQLQKQINDWLSKNVHKGDVQGTLMPDVLGSSTPLPEEKLTTTPAANQPAPGGKFTEVLSVKVSILVIGAAAIQDAGRAQLEAAALKTKPVVSVLATQRPVSVTVTKSTPSKDGTTLTIVVSASGQIMQRVLPHDIAKMLAGKSVNQAKSEIMNGGVGIIGATNTRIDISPPILGILPFRAEQIQVIVEPGPATGTPNG